MKRFGPGLLLLAALCANAFAAGGTGRAALAAVGDTDKSQWW